MIFVHLQEYEFIDRMEPLRNQITGEEYLANFDYWINGFYYMREIANVSSLWFE